MENKTHRALIMLAATIFATLVFIPQALASLQVTGFSCNGETGTVNVPNNIAFTCSATINNPDDSTASLSSAKLYIDGSWATQSYDASGFSTSLATGASSTATFTDITSTTPGSHKFSYILLDGVSDTFVADTVVNVMDIRIARVRTNTTSAGQNAPFNVIAEVSAGGAMSVTTTIDVSDCALATGEQASKTVGSLTEGAQTSVSWKLIMGANDCSYTVSVTGTGSGRVTDDVSGSVQSTSTGGSSPSPGSSSSSGGGGGGGGGGGVALVDESVLLSSIPAGSIGTFAFNKFADVAVYEVAFNANINLENAKLTVKEARLASTSPSASENAKEAVYKYVSITREKIKNEEISDTKIRFKVPNSWLNKESIIPESVKLRRLAGSGWETKPTLMIGSESGYTAYEASVDGFSTFAIVGEKSAAAVKLPEEEKEQPAAVEKPPEEAQQPQGQGTMHAKGEGAAKALLEKVGGISFAAKVIWTLVLLITGVLIAVEIMHFMHRKMPPLKLPKIPPPPTIKQQK